MPLENRDLAAGTRLVARHKKQEHICEVLQTDDGLRYRLADGTEYKSPSSAGRAVTGGIAVNGWRFWSLEGELKAKPEKATKAKAATKKPAKSAKKPGKKGKPKKKAQRAASRDSFECGVCRATFPTMKKATDHAIADHKGLLE